MSSQNELIITALYPNINLRQPLMLLRANWWQMIYSDFVEQSGRCASHIRGGGSKWDYASW